MGQVFRAGLFFFTWGVYGVGSAVETTTYFHNDLLKSSYLQTNRLGDNVRSQPLNDTPFGEYDVSEYDESDIRYTGKMEDSETGLTYMNARYYDARIGRFISTDPVDFIHSGPAFFNRYVYANNNPYKYVDPTGEFPVMLPIVQALAVTVGMFYPSSNEKILRGKTSVTSEITGFIEGLQLRTEITSSGRNRAMLDSYIVLPNGQLLPNSIMTMVEKKPFNFHLDVGYSEVVGYQVNPPLNHVLRSENVILKQMEQLGTVSTHFHDPMPLDIKTHNLRIKLAR